jgi:O-antigen ligase
VFCVITIVLSSSRYGILSVGFGFLFVLGLAIKTRRGLSRVFGLVMLFVLFSGVFLIVSQRGSHIIAKRFDELRNPTQVASLRGRLDFLWVDAVSYFLSSPIVGHGPAKTIFENTFTDSEYLDILKWYGVVGFSIYIWYYGWPLLQIRKGLKTSVSLPHGLEGQLEANLLAMRIGFVMLCMALFMNIGMFTCFNWYLMCYLWVWVGVSVRAAEAVSEATSLAGVPSASANRSPVLWPSLATSRLGNAASNL